MSAIEILQNSFEYIHKYIYFVIEEVRELRVHIYVNQIGKKKKHSLILLMSDRKN